MKKVNQPNSAGFIVSNKAVEAPAAATLASEPAVEKLSKRASKKAEAAKEEETATDVVESSATPDAPAEESAADTE